MTYLRLFRLTLAELFVFFTFMALSFIALLKYSDTTARVVGGVFWLAILAAIAVAITPQAAKRPFCIGFLCASLLHLGLMQFVAHRGQSNYDIDLPTFWTIEVIWEALPAESKPPPRQTGVPVPGRPGTFVRGMSAYDSAHANFQGIATQLFSIFYGMLTGFLAQGLSRRQAAEVSIRNEK